MELKKITAITLSAALLTGVAACSSGGGKSSEASGSSESSNGTVRVWFMEGSVSEKAQKYLTEEFAKENPGSELKIEIQQWDGIASKLQTSLASKNESPDLVEIGNTQTSSFTSVGAFDDVSSMKEELGGKNLIPSFVKASTIDGKLYALPLYAGARGVFYRKDLFEKAGIAVPETISDFTKAVIDLQKANPDNTPDFSGMYFAAVDPHGVESYLFADGFDYAKDENGKWVGLVDSPDSVAALKNAQNIFQNGTKYALDSKAGQKSFQRYFNEGKTGVLIGTGNVGVKIDKKLWDEDKVGVFAIPSNTPGKPGATFAGGSNVALAANSNHKELAKKALKVIFSEGFQKAIAEDGWVPGNTSYGKDVKGPFGKLASTIIENSKLTPNSPEWGVNFDGKVMNEFFTRIAKGEDVDAVAKEFNDKLNETLNK